MGQQQGEKLQGATRRVVAGIDVGSLSAEAVASGGRPRG